MSFRNVNASISAARRSAAVLSTRPSRSTPMFTRYELSLSHAQLGTRSYSSTVHENDPEIMDKEKQRNLSNQQYGKSTTHDYAPGWNEYIATSSEAHVKADKATGTVEEMQTKTIEHIKKRHHGDDAEATSSKITSNEEASYDADRIDGPLLKAKGKHDSGIASE